MIEIAQLTPQVSVSGQITMDDIPYLVEQGIHVLVCNRPDNEAPDQPHFQSVAAAAQAHGIETVNIPFAGGQMQPEQAQAFSDLLAAGKKIHAYCRTGNRSSQLFNAALALSKG